MPARFCISPSAVSSRPSVWCWRCSNVVAMSGEGFVKYAARRFGKDFGRVEVMVDVGLVLLAVVTPRLL